MSRKIQIAIPHILFLAVLLSALLLPDTNDVTSHGMYVGFLLALELWLVWRSIRAVKKQENLVFTAVFSIVFILLGAWELITVKILKHSVYLYPAPERVLEQFREDWLLLIKCIGMTTVFLACGLGVAVILGSVLGMIAGWHPKARKILMPVIKVITPIPALVYMPYIIVMSPTFFTASIITIFLTVFWSLMLSIMYNVSAMDINLLNMIRTLNVGHWSLFKDILVPYTLPRVMKSMPLLVSSAFMVLFNAEMIGNTMLGVGWYIKFNAGFSEYTKVVTGIFTASLLIVVINRLTKLLEKKLIIWQPQEA